MRTIRTARKPHKCSLCIHEIVPGERYVDERSRYPVYAEHLDTERYPPQTSVYYMTSRLHTRHLDFSEYRTTGETTTPEQDLTIACVGCGGYDIKVMAADETGGWLECQHCGAFFYHEFTNDEKELIRNA